MGSVVAEFQAGLILMFNSPDDPTVPIDTAEVRTGLEHALTQATQAGIQPDHVVVDPGIGFRVQGDSIWTLLTHLGDLNGLGAGILIGHSRKRFLGAATGLTDPRARDLATAVLSAALATAGADVLRVHNPRWTHEALAIQERWRVFHGAD
jgi:dihydropteroate synthase